MNQVFVNRFMAARPTLAAAFAVKHPEDYGEIVKAVVSAITADEDDADCPDPERIVEIDHGDYQGTLLFVIGRKGYQPIDYWYVRVDYGSCSGCDTLQGIREYGDDPPTQEQVDDYMTLALHIVQKIKLLGDGDEDS